jgi:iron complex transport system ATP-binding protein
MCSPLVDIRNLSLSLGGKIILRNISVSISKSETVFLIGPNGAGKTSLLKCLVRIHAHPDGAITIGGRLLDSYSPRELARRVSYVPQTDGGPSPFTVHEFVAMGRYPYLRPFSSPTAEDREAIRTALAVTGMAAFADRPLGTLSGGERQKVSVAAALAQGTDIMLLDEPAAFLDPRNRAEILTLLTRINREQGVTILSVTHDINTAVIADRRIIALVEGRLAYCGRAKDLMNSTVLREIYGTSFLFAKHPQTGLNIVVPEAP